MYNAISEKFRDKSRHYNNRLAVVSVPIILIPSVIFGCIPLYSKDYAKWLVPLLFGFVFIFCLVHCYMIIFISVRKEPEFSRNICWRLRAMVRLYKTVMHNNDIEILIKILKEEGANTRPKVLEVLRHYQCLLPRNTIGRSQFISILALSVSVLAFIFSDILSMSFDYQLIILLCLLGILFLYILGYALNKEVFYFFGEAALITRIEMAVSEIWMKSLIK
ncbi:MAG: hypothetical protein K2K12_02130 [Clostridia bacterium]|nr:hypothetical protein [Clostridia bacterium]